MLRGFVDIVRSSLKRACRAREHGLRSQSRHARQRPHHPRRRRPDAVRRSSRCGERVTFGPDYLRGLDSIGDFAFAGLVLQERIEAKKAKPRCAIQVIDLRTGDVVHWVRFESLLHEFYDVAVLHDCARPMAIGFQTDEIRRVITIGGNEGGALQLLGSKDSSG